MKKEGVSRLWFYSLEPNWEDKTGKFLGQSAVEEGFARERTTYRASHAQEKTRAAYRQVYRDSKRE